MGAASTLCERGGGRTLSAVHVYTRSSRAVDEIVNYTFNTGGGDAAQIPRTQPTPPIELHTRVTARAPGTISAMIAARRRASDAYARAQIRSACVYCVKFQRVRVCCAHCGLRCDAAHKAVGD